MKKYEKKLNLKEDYYSDQFKKLKISDDDLKYGIGIKVIGQSGETHVMPLGGNTVKALLDFYKKFEKEKDKFNK